MPTGAPSDAWPAPVSWSHWNRDELFRVQDLCLIAITDERTLSAGWLDALPPYRAIMMLRLAAASPGPVTQEAVDTALAKALSLGGGAGPGWLTGRRGRTCADCGCTVWPEDNHVGHDEFGHTGRCQAPARPGQRHPISGEAYVVYDYAAGGQVLMPVSSFTRVPSTPDSNPAGPQTPMRPAERPDRASSGTHPPAEPNTRDR